MPSSIHLQDSARTSRGRFAVGDAWAERMPSGRYSIVYSFENGAPSAPARLRLEDLASLFGLDAELTVEELLERVTLFARESGPLFGEARAELAADWQLAIAVAQEALRLQEQVNGTRQWSDRNNVVEKRIVKSEIDRASFTHYHLQCATGETPQGMYASSVSNQPLARASKRGKFVDYTFATAGTVAFGDAEWYGFDVHVFACKGALTPSLLALLLCALNERDPTFDELRGMGAAQLSEIDLGTVESQIAAYEEGDNFTAVASPLGKEDAPCIQHIVHAIAALHLRGVTVDLFKDDDSEGSLAFDTYLNSLWYDFAMQLGTVTVGYCEECGRGFSTVGHRGIPRRFCSDACRTKKKNRLDKEQTEVVRTRFMQGESVAEIAATETYAGKARTVAERDVVGRLRKWPQLKQAVVRELKGELSKPAPSLEACPLTQRCIVEGVIDAPTLAQLQKRARTRGR